MNALLEWVGLEKIQWIVQDFYTSRFAESLERCQMESQKISPPDPLVLPIARRAWLQSSFSLGCSLLISLAGCPGKAPDRTKNDAAGKVGRGDLPPLKIGILDCDELSEVLVNRWQEYSDQPIELIRFERLKVGTQDSPSLDVILYPGNFLGTLFEKEWIAPLPSLLLERLGGQKQNGDKRNTGKKSLTPKNLDSEDSPQGFESWSSRWRSIAHYNGKSVGLPLGAPCWVAATRGLDIEPLKRLHQAIASNQNNSELASESLEAFLQKSESTLQDSLEARQALLAEKLNDLPSIDRRALVERFLWMMTTSESRYRGLIDPYKVTARLGLPEFARSARFLHRLALIEPTTILASPVEAWERVAEGKAVFGIGWPRTDGFQRAGLASDSKPLQLVPFLYNGAQGLLASLGRKTRQSSMSVEFMHWLHREDNRAALQAKSPRIEVLEIENDTNRVREDYRDYQTLQRLEAGNSTLDMTPRFVDADLLIDGMADALLDILADPESASARLEQCKLQWAKSIDSIGAESLRRSLERATGLSN
ncbi:MAG: hypothetical protein LW720_06000 [Pirellula sp.]|nr:hypothetical protein [Pirellula sp.]